MAIFDKASPGILGRASEWMTPERAIAMQGLGAIVGQVSAGQPVNASPAYNALLQRQQRSQQERMLNESGLLKRFNPEQRAILAQMEPGAAQQIIAQTLFREPPAPTKGVEINGRLVDPYTGREIANFADEPTPEGWRNMTPEEIQATPGLEPGKTYQVGISGANTGKIVPAGGQALVTVDNRDVPTPAQGYRNVFDERGNFVGQELISGGNAEREIEAAREEKKLGLEGQIAMAEQMANVITQVMEDPALDSITGAFQGRLPAGLPLVTGGQEGANLIPKINQLKGGAFLEAIDQMRGLGALSNMEGQTAAQAVARLDTIQDGDEYRQALKELLDLINGGLENMRRGVSAQPAEDLTPEERRYLGLE